jgi:hypothetical protein
MIKKHRMANVQLPSQNMYGNKHTTTKMSNFIEKALLAALAIT